MSRFTVPMLATFSILGIIIIETFATLCLLWIVSLGLVWVSFFYYYTR